MGCAYTRPLKVFSNKAKEDVIPREAERSREAWRPTPPPMVCRQCRQAVGALRIAIPPRRYIGIDLKISSYALFILFSLPIAPRQIPDLVGHRTVGAEAMGELVSRQEPYYANTGAVEPGCIKTP